MQMQMQKNPKLKMLCGHDTEAFHVKCRNKAQTKSVTHSSHQLNSGSADASEELAYPRHRRGDQF